MNQIALATIGRIVVGEEIGQYVRVEDDSDNTGGFLILVSSEPAMKTRFDSWVEDRGSVDMFFTEHGWTFDWSPAQ